MHVCADRCASSPQFSKTSRLADPVFHFCQRGASHSQGLGSLHHASNCCRVHGAATLSHSQVFDQEFHPPSIGPRQGINCRRAIVWSDCLGQWSPSRCSANSPLPRHGPICTSAVALLEQFEGSQKKKKDAAVQPPVCVCRGPGDSTTAFLPSISCPCSLLKCIFPAPRAALQKTGSLPVPMVAPSRHLDA